MTRFEKVEEYEPITRLIGKTIQEIWISPNKIDIAFVVDGGQVMGFAAEGDCCSSSWFENISGVNTAKGAKVIAVEEVNLGEIDHPDDGQSYDCLRAYSTKIKLEGRPDLEIEYRNDSNGYYGGSIDKGVDDLKNLTLLTDDF